MKCGREPGGEKADKLGICPAATDPTFDGFNLGINAGRICWLVAGTFCGGKVQGSFAKKRISCKSCEFYKQIHAEEGTSSLYSDSENIFAITHIGRVMKAKRRSIFDQETFGRLPAAGHSRRSGR